MDRYGLIGYPLGHSFSKDFFNDKFKDEGIDAEYVNFEIPSIENFPDIIATNNNLKGLNVTIPYKQQVIGYLDDISKEAKEIGAVNVVRVFREHNGKTKLKGYNSDVIGFVKSIEPLLKKHHRKALILGTGGASRAVRYGLENNLGIETLYVSRTSKKGAVTYKDVTPDLIQEYEIIVNCTPCGMYPKTEECPELPYEAMTANNLLYDLIYNPDETLFMKKGAEHGAEAKNGLEMLLLQAYASWKFWNE